MKSLYYCKCGKTFYKSIDSSTTGYRMPDYGPGHACYGCPYICDIIAWDHARSVTAVKSHECRASKALRYETKADLSLGDKCVGRIYSLDLDFLHQIRTFADTLDGIEPDRYALSSRPSDYGGDGRYIMPIYPDQNKKGIAAKQQIFDKFFNSDGSRKDFSVDQEKKRILDVIKKSKEVRKSMGKLNLSNINSGLNSIKSITQNLDNLSHSENVPADLIHPAAENPYSHDDTPESIKNLADSISTNGLIHPLAVNRISNDGYQLISGERRLKAITEHLHWKTIPCMVYDHISETSAALKLHAANLEVRDYTTEQKLRFYEETNRLLHQMKESGEYTGPIQKGIAELLGVSDRQVRKYKAVSENLPEETKLAVIRGDVSINDACRLIPQKPTTEASLGSDGTGTSSGFDKVPHIGESAMAQAEESHDIKTPDADSRYWEDKILAALQQHYGEEKIFAYYVFQVPTTAEAIRDTLKPKYGFSGGSVSFSGEQWGDCTARSQKITVSRGKKSIDLTYSQIDEIIRKSIREGKWLSKEKAKSIIAEKYHLID